MKHNEIKPFTLRIIKRVIFRDWNGTINEVYEVGDLIEATFDAGHYWVHSMGGIFKDEAEMVN